MKRNVSLEIREAVGSIKQLSSEINQLAKEAREKSASVHEALHSITEVSETMVEVTSDAIHGTQKANRMSDSGRMGTRPANHAQDGMNKINTSSGEKPGEISELGTRADEIGKIAAAIDGLAAETNLLALNAATEAARSVEQDKGYAVIADETRKLIERTATTTREMVEVISSLQKRVEEAAQATAEGNTFIIEGYQLAAVAGEVLKQISQIASEANSQIEQITYQTIQINTAANELVQTIDRINGIMELADQSAD